MHSLLKRQLRRHFGEGNPPPLQSAEFISAVNAAYEQFDIDREMLERSLELSSQELLQANSELRSLFHAMDDLILVFDREGRCLKIVETNPSVFLESVHGMLGQRVHEVLPERRADILLYHIRLALEHQRREKVEFAVRIDGEKVWIDGTISPLSEETVIWVARDITKRKQAEVLRARLERELRIRNTELEASLAELKQMQATLIQSEKMASVGLLTAGIAHEINNPLAFVSSNLNRFQEYFDDALKLFEAWKTYATHQSGEENGTDRLADVRALESSIDPDFIVADFASLMQHTRDGTDRIRVIVDKLRGFSHANGSDRADVSINEALDDTLTLVWNEIKYKAQVRKEYGTVPPVPFNMGELRQVFVNLIINGVHAIEKEGVITLRTFPHDHSAVIEISDTGCGIPDAIVHRIFDPFFTTKPVGKGTGLGLWISSSIVQKHGGTISVKSAVGRGTTFIIRLPLQANARS